jgi:nitrile hydratase accessory protein
MIPSKLKEKNFQKPWHAQIFAITVSLSENKVFEWAEFSDFLAHEIKMDNNQIRNGSDDYFYSWVKALEKLLIKKKITSFPRMVEIKNLWTSAFLKTPHGKPVKIGDI